MITGKYTQGNKDDIEAAVKALNEFTHNWCMNCTETEKQNDLVFRCNGCEFEGYYGKHTHKCALKVFKNNHLPDFKEFGCMGDL